MSKSHDDVHQISNIYPSKLKFLSDSRLPDVCARVRQEFANRVHSDPCSYDQCDVDRVQSNEWTVTRFVLSNDLDYEKSVKQMDECMKWRKQMQINFKSRLDVPIEVFKAAGFYELGVDKNGLSVIYGRGKTSLRIKRLQPIIELLGSVLMNDFDTRFNGKGVVIVADLQDCGLKNVDLDMLQFMLAIGRKYFPFGLSRIIVLNMPWYLKGIVAIIKMWLTEDELFMLKFVTGAELFKYIDESQVPAYLGGQNRADFTLAPAGCRPFLDLAEDYDIPRDEAKKILKKFQHIIDEGELLVKHPERFHGKHKKSKETLSPKEDMNNNSVHYPDDVSDSEVSTLME